MLKNQASFQQVSLQAARIPAAFVGTARLDYLFHFLSGLEAAAPNGAHPFAENQFLLMEKYLLCKEGASFRGSLNAHTLFMRCYGVHSNACAQYYNFLTLCSQSAIQPELPFIYPQNLRPDMLSGPGAQLSPSIASLAERFSNAKEKAKASFFPAAKATFVPYLSPGLFAALGKVEAGYAGILPIVKALLPAGTRPEELWLYLHYERFFLQLRFLYRETGVFTDGQTLFPPTAEGQGISTLTLLHGLAWAAGEQENYPRTVVLKEKGGAVTQSITPMPAVWDDIIGGKKDISFGSKHAFAAIYEQWKKRVLHSAGVLPVAATSET